MLPYEKYFKTSINWQHRHAQRSSVKAGCVFCCELQSGVVCVFQLKLCIVSILSFMMTTDPPKLDLGTLEEDDDFEEFPAEVYADDDQYEAEVPVWEDNWEDDVVADDFHNVLREQLDKLKHLNMVVDDAK